MKIIGLIGYKRSGKSLAAELICKEYHYMRMSFASPIRKMLLALGVSPDHLYEKKEEVIPWLGVTGRWLLQSLGTEWGRNLIDKDIWVKAAIERLEPGFDYVFDDVRFIEECHAIIERKGMLIRIVRDGCTSGDHESEQHVAGLPFHEMIYNKELEQFKEDVIEVAGNYAGHYDNFDWNLINEHKEIK